MSVTGVVLALVCAVTPTEATVVPAAPLETPRHVWLGFRLGSYYPWIDSEPGLSGTPYQSTFGRNGMLLFEFEADYFFWQGFGALGAGLSIGYAEKYANAFLTDGSRAAEKTSLQVFPVRAHLVYWFDWMLQKWGVPVVPYLKGSLSYWPWRVNTGPGVESALGATGVGGRFGIGGTVGLALALNFSDPQLARDFDTSVGVNHTYLFAEWTYERVNSFGQPGIDLSSRRWTFGFALDF
ncbi:MAG: MXAN_2562 family outer membrane beta-barrel protein [Myxococcaceae bacterium]